MEDLNYNPEWVNRMKKGDGTKDSEDEDMTVDEKEWENRKHLKDTSNQ